MRPSAPFALSCALVLTVLSGCEPIPGLDTASAEDRAELRLEARSLRNCLREVEKRTGQTGATHNTDVPVVEVNQYIVNLPNADQPYTCLTDDAGKPTVIYETRLATA